MKKNIKKIFNNLKKKIKKLNKNIKYIMHDCDKFYISILFDIALCYIKYGTSSFEYRIFEFYKINSLKRNTYLNKYRHDKFLPKLIDKNSISDLKNKNKFNGIISDYLNTKIYNIKELSFKEFEVLALDKKKFVCRSNDNFNDKFKIVDVKDYRSPAFMLEDIKKDNLPLIEPYNEHNKSINKLCDYSVLKLVTLNNKEKVEIISSYMDFINDTTLTGYIDSKTHKIKGKLRNNEGISFEEIPQSEISIKDFEIPKYNDACEIVKKASLLFPNIREIEWRIVIGNSKIFVVGANLWNDYIFSQIPEYLKNRVGLMNIYNKTLKNRD